MALIQCPKCKKKVDRKNKTCPHCGSPIKQKVYILYIILVFVLLLVVKYVFEECSNANINPSTNTTDTDETPLTPKEKAAQKLAEEKLRAEQKQAEEKHKKLEATIGKQPTKSAFNGSVRIVKEYIEKIAKDPGSINYVSWSEISYNESDGWLVKVVYRGKNSFGGYVVNCNWFVIKFGIVSAMKSCDAYQ